MAKTLPRLIAAAVSAALLLAATNAGAATRNKTTSKAAEPSRGSATQPAASSARHGVGRGDTEIGFFFNYTTFDDANVDTATLGAVFGKYLRDTLELRITPVINYTNAAGFKNFLFNPYVTVEKLFPNSSPVVPYVGGGIGVTVGIGSGGGVDTTDLGLFVTPVGGLKFFVSERMALEYALSLQYGFDYNCVDAAGYSTCNTGTRSAIDNTLRFSVYF